jgi:hypothetical protein
MAVNEAVIAALQAEITALKARLAEAEAELTEERFADVPHYEPGDRLLVRRVIFGKPRWWPARVQSVRFHYSSGINAAGTPWEHKLVSYSVTHEKAGGTGHADTTTAYWDSEVRPDTEG